MIRNVALFAVCNVHQNHNDQPAQDPSWYSGSSSSKTRTTETATPKTSNSPVPTSYTTQNLSKSGKKFVDVGSFFEPLAFGSRGLLPKSIQIPLVVQYLQAPTYSYVNSTMQALPTTSISRSTWVVFTSQILQGQRDSVSQTGYSSSSRVPICFI